MGDIVYHCSDNGNIKELIPQISSHGMPYVYATPYKIISLVFGIKEHCDYIVHPIVDREGNCSVIEMTPNALARYYRNKSAYIYQVNRDEFDARTRWIGEVCSTHAVTPLGVEYVPNLEEAILQEQKKGNIEIISYDERNNHGANMDEEFAKRALGSIIRNPNPDYVRCRINYLKNLDNKCIFHSFQEIVNLYLNCFKGNKEPTRQDEQSVIPQRYIDEYKKNDSDEVVFMAFSRLLYCNPERLPEAVAEIRVANDKFLPRIVLRLTKIRNLANQGLHIEKQYSRE